MSHDVHLNRAHAPVYPARCVVCGKDSPDAHLAVSAWEGYWWTFFTSTRASARPPACPACRDRFTRSRRARFLVTLAIAAATLALAMVLIPDTWPRGDRRIARYGIGAVGAVACVLVHFIRSLPFSLSQPSKNSVIYEFKNPEYAQEFARLNGAEFKE